MISPVVTQIEATIIRHVAGAVQKKLVQSGNTVFRQGLLSYIVTMFYNVTMSPSAVFWPWRLPTQSMGQNPTIGGFAYLYGYGLVPYEQNAIGIYTLDYSRARRYSNPPGTWLKSATRETVGALLTVPAIGYPGINIVSASDIPLRTVGNTWFHPAFTGTVSTGIGGIGGASYLTTFAPSTGTAWAPSFPQTNANAYVRITSGADAGLYRFRYWDSINLRAYLSNLDGTPFIAAGGAVAGLSCVIYYRTSAFYNENAVIPVSSGSSTTIFGGAFDPGENRASYMFRLHMEKTGSPSPSGGAHLTGSYWMSVRPYAVGDGTSATVSQIDQAERGSLGNSSVAIPYAGLSQNGALTAGFALNVGGCPGLALDQTNQRLWGCSYTAGGGSIWWWLYKSPEAIHEVASGTAAPNDPIANLQAIMSAANPRSLEQGTDNCIYVALLAAANTSVVKIDPSLVATITNVAGVSQNMGGLKIDKSRNRATALGTVSTAAAGNTVTVVGGACTQADVGRAITLAGGSADNGTYKIATYVAGTQVTVTTLAGAAVSFAGSAASGSMKIGDRIYLFFNDTVGWAGSAAGFINMRYIETEAFGTVLTTGDLAVVASTGRYISTGHWGAIYGKVPVDIDPATGNLFWCSLDTSNYLNRFDVTSRTVSQKATTAFTVPADAGVAAVPTSILSVGVNPHASFREVWLGTDQGYVRFNPDHADLSTLTTGAYAYALATNQYRRYFGDGVTVAYTQPVGYTRPDGTVGAARNVCGMAFGLDGKFYGAEWGVQGWFSQYVRETDLFVPVQDTSPTRQLNANRATFMLMTPYGEVVTCLPRSGDVTSSGGAPTLYVASALTDYQWIGAAWVAKEAVRGIIPDATSQPGCLAKPLHTTADALLYGVTVAFGTGAGADIDQFIGRMSQKQAMQADGAWAVGAASNWKGSNFTAADVGRLLRVESGAQAGIYLVTAYVNTTTLTVQTLGRAAFNASADAGPLNYTLWHLGSTLAGAETCTCVAGNGLCPDNTQDITNINAEFYAVKTKLSEQVEAIKVAHGLVPVPGSATTPVLYFDEWPLSADGSAAPAAYPGGLALSVNVVAAAIANQVLDHCSSRGAMDNTGGKPNFPLVYYLGGADPLNVLTGNAFTVDFGADVEIGSVIFRGRGGGSDYNGFGPLHTEANNTGGLLGNLHKALAAGGAPVNSVSPTHLRPGLTGVSGITVARTRPPTATLAAGNFLGAASVAYSDGITVQNGNTFVSALGRFTGLTGSVVQITSGADIGYYRVTAVSVDGATATVRKLAQTVVAWLASSAALSFVIYADAAREEDILIAGALKTTIEMLTSPTVARIRSFWTAAQNNAAWNVLTPTWALVKRLEHSVMAVPPDAVDNGTYISAHGAEDPSYTGAHKCVFSLTDLTAAQRTGRWWKFDFCGRFPVFALGGQHWLSCLEFYDTSGRRLLPSPSMALDTVTTEPDFLAGHVTRLDFIQALYAASALVPGVAALATVSGAPGSTVTLAAAAAFLPLRIAQGATITAVGADNFFDIGGADRPFTAADVGRIMWVQAGTNPGYFRILTIPTAVRVSVAKADGSAVILAADATPRAWSLHEGILASAGVCDFISIGGYGEFGINAVSADLKTITLNDVTGLAVSGQTWEIRRRASNAVQWTIIAVADGSQVARLLYSRYNSPLQPGDVVQDSKGALSFHPVDVGTPVTRADGATTVGTGNFGGSLFSPDDVGRVLVITTGGDKGGYKIATYVSAAAITVLNIRTGAAVAFAASAAALGYSVVGEKRFRISRYATMLKQ